MKDDLTLDTEELDGRTKTESALVRLAPLLEQYREGTGQVDEQDQTVLVDLLADLMHYAHATDGVDFDLAVGTAGMHFSDEIDDDEGRPDMTDRTFDLDIEESKRSISDREALDAIAVFLGSHEQWEGADVCEMVAETVERTGRPPVGDQTSEDLAMYRKKADAAGWQHDGDQ